MRLILIIFDLGRVTGETRLLLANHEAGVEDGHDKGLIKHNELPQEQATALSVWSLRAVTATSMLAECARHAPKFSTRDLKRPTIAFIRTLFDTQRS